MSSACPIDEKPLSLTKADGIEVMSCEACKGAWLPASSAGSLLSRLASATPPQQKFFDKVRQEGSASSLECLECGTELLTVEHRDVDIDVCPDCGGIWFDGGELQRFRQSDFKKPVRPGTVVAGAAALAATGVAGAAAMSAVQPPPQAESMASSVAGFVGDGVLEVAGEVAGSVFTAILESIFD